MSTRSHQAETYGGIVVIGPDRAAMVSARIVRICVRGPFCCLTSSGSRARGARLGSPTRLVVERGS
jgi:hypothetical protein